MPIFLKDNTNKKGTENKKEVAIKTLKVLYAIFNVLRSIADFCDFLSS